jgi:hypothetical protein
MREFLVAFILVAAIAFMFFQFYPDKLAVVLNLLGL